ncbi:uncharacterized protein GIQ15_03512 [Arthroderma uncinatum]|uniref:uncharacterized protein n=1 Tax=Arthroderma uncinatum TaxID=74035 RepID=UPI00144AABBD|nr:uncharacterized protein GIQ15_03512 [Arthroderma uncinatum]KAF3484188.1 hypothetical protein GIQ15_03512 [Arthroderma uncinatum]
MAELSQHEASIIESNPLASLDRVRGLLQEAEQVYESRITSYNGSADGLDLLYRKTISRLFTALQGEEAAFNLHSRTADQTVDSELAELKGKQLQPGHFNYSQYRPLVQLVIQRALDTEIWEAVYTLLDAISPTRTPPSIPLPFYGMPARFLSSSSSSSSSWSRVSEQTHELVEARLFEEIRECTHKDVEGFFSKYFEGKDWNAQAEAVSRRMLDPGDDSGWPSFPNPPSEAEALDWWFGFQDRFLSDARSVYFSTSSKGDLTGSGADRQVDLLVRARGTSNIGEKHNWKDIRVVGKLKRAEAEIGTKKTLLQMASYVREVFIAQPTRRFVHAFIVCGLKAEAWIFDRSGPFSSGSYNIHEDPKRFFLMVVGYTMMSDEELGLDTFITQRDDGANTITTKGAKGGEIVIHLDPMPLYSRCAIVGRGTTSFLANIDDKVQGVAKFSWTSDKRAAEKDLLALAYERGIKGVAEIVGYHDITSIAELRGDLAFEKRHAFRSAPSSARSSFSQYHSKSQSQSSTQLRLSASEKPTSRKRRSPDKETPSKRSRLNSQLSKNDPQETKLETELPFSIRSMHSPSHFDGNSQEREPYDNRILRCLVTSPAGRPIYEYDSPMELLMAFRDAIRAHRSLYLKGNILHQDISENNIIITNPESADGNFGMLIDLDLAKEMSSGQGGARHQTGTMEFMAIEVLRGIDHTYRHDLESFLYVFIWQCARNGWERFNRRKGKPRHSLLDEWHIEDYLLVAGRKSGHIGAQIFEYLLDEMPPELECVKPLCRILRQILFPIRKNDIFTGTPMKPETLYDPIIQAFDNAIENIG